MRLYFLIVFLVAAAQCQQIEVRYSALAEANNKAIAEALAKFADSKANAARELTTLVDSTRLIQTASTELKTNYGTELMLGRFYPGYKEVIAVYNYTLQQGEETFINNLLIGAVNGVGAAGATQYINCYESDVANYLSKIIASVPQKLVQLSQDEVAFKTKMPLCAAPEIIASGTVKECIDNVLVTNPYPTADNTSLQTTQSMNKLIGCIANSANSVLAMGNRGIGVFKESVPDKFIALVRDQFGNNDSTPIAFPSANILNTFSINVQKSVVRFKAGAELAYQVHAKVVAVKATNYQSAYNFLLPKLQVLNDFIAMNEGSASSTVLQCYGTAKAFKVSAIQSKATSLVNCITTAGQVPNALAIATAEASAKDIESKEKAFWSAIECSRKLSNIFNMNNFYQCLELANNATVSKLTVLDIQVNSIALEGSELLSIAERCKCQAAVEFQREVRTALYNLRECVISAGQSRIDVPEQQCALSTCV